MKKIAVLLMALLVLILGACSGGQESDKKDSKDKKDKSAQTRTYKSENGSVKVPVHPKRVVVLSSFAGNLMALDVPVVGADAWSMSNPRFKEGLKNAKEVSEENLEQITELNPDLIIALSTVKNVDKLKKIAPTVTYTYGKADYLQQHIEIGKLVNKEKEAKDWVADYKKRAADSEKKIKDKIGQDASVSVIENFDKQLYVFGDHWGRGTEVLYQALHLKMPEKVEKMVKKDGYYALSSEVLPEYAGDYIVVSKDKQSDNSFQKTDTYKNIPAVKDNHVLEVSQKEFYFNDPLTVDHALDVFTDYFTK
ncbi:iron-hydroxamate ABC transporter substrate-binding protein [Aciduricibacillus chroicocephali]|uniref:Iron-hydroxamate ABC transporter substrate-binding protein n=1 Tax=Aciduricibacillus chroicocephali TaxID=3054939 RepID=A0ABY9KXX2_9BACI|nr:iron-hydroxamate ABC transporter substrate-binding protein [Bacillaceae bacterium 44XB]